MVQPAPFYLEQPQQFVMRQPLLFLTLTLCSTTWAAEVRCLVADFKAALNVPAPSREPAAHDWIKARGSECSFEQLTAIKNNLGSWMGVANSHRVTVQLQRHLESYYVAKNEWSESLYASKAAFVAPYSARTMTATTNVIVSPPPIAVGAFQQPMQQNKQLQDSNYQTPLNTQQPGYQDYNQAMPPGPASNGYQNNNQPRPQVESAEPNVDQ